MLQKLSHVGAGAGAGVGVGAGPPTNVGEAISPGARNLPPPLLPDAAGLLILFPDAVPPILIESDCPCFNEKSPPISPIPRSIPPATPFSSASACF